MSDHIQISDVSPRVRYVGDNATVAFTYPFPIFNDEDLEVYVDGTLQTLTSDYSVTGAGLSAGGSVTCVSAPASGVPVTLVRRLDIARTSDFQASGEFRAKVINDELDFQIAALQQIEDDVSRSIRLKRTDGDALLEIPEAAERAGRALTFDDSGDVSVAALVDIGIDAVVSDATPASGTSAGTAGISSDLSASDHAHPLPAVDGSMTRSDDQLAVAFASQAEAEAGTATDKALNALRVSQAIAALAAGSDQIARDMAASALAYAMAANDATSVTGSIGKFWLSDDFESDSLNVSTNATYDATGDFYTSEVTGYTANVIPDMTANDAPSGDAIASAETSGGAWQAFNQDTASRWETDFTEGVSWVGFHHESARTITKFVTTNTNSSYEINPIDFRFQGSNNGTDWTTLKTVTGANGSAGVVQTYDTGITEGAYAYHRILVDNNTSSWPTVGLAGFEMYEDNLPVNVTLSPSAVTLTTSDPTDIIAYFVFKPLESITFGTDVIGKISRNGGTDYATGTWTKVGDIGASGDELWRLEADVTGPSGSSLIYEISTANEKEIELHDCVGLIAIY